jgi:CubicO group peptidase (beta-lactamase class C family)
MPELAQAKPEEIGFDPVRLQRAYELLHQWIEADKLPAAGVSLGRQGRMLAPKLIGRQRMEKEAPPLRSDALFLVASITKPVTVTAAMLLVERGLVSLEDRVSLYVPRFAQNGKESVQIRHLMTHTSGLPDMLPENDQLRAANKPFAAFVDAICKTPLLFAPGTKVSYQSMGTAMLAEIVHQVSGVTLAEYLRREIFTPLGMNDTSLGWQPEKKERIAGVRISVDPKNAHWAWNSPYWLGFGAPWGGMITSPADFARFCTMMLNGGSLGGVRILAPSTVRAMTTNQLAAMPEVPEYDRRAKPWGLGWRLNWPAHSANFGDLLGPRTYGHWGATGTVCWLDPDSGAYCVLFTTQPQEPEGRFLARFCNTVAAAMV